MKTKSPENNSKYDPPKSDRGDTLNLGAKGILSLIPAASELFEYFVKPPMERRLEHWRKNIAQALITLEENQGIKLDELQVDEHFITIVAQVSSVAIRNHQKEKLQALKNAIINSAVGTNFGEDIELIYVRFIEELTPTHFYLLKFFVDNENSVSALKSYPDIYQLFLNTGTNKVMQDEFKMLLGDLDVRGLIRISQDIDDFEDIYQASSLLLQNTNDSLPRILVTEVAKKFLKFISHSNIENKI